MRILLVVLSLLAACLPGAVSGQQADLPQQRDLVNQVKEMAQAGIRMIGLGALGYDARPEFNKTTAAVRKIMPGTTTTTSISR